MSVFLLIDSRLAPQTIDLNFIDFLGINSIPFIILFTKADKLAVSQLKLRLAKYQEQLKANWEELPGFIVTSSVKRRGRNEMLNYIRETNELWKKG